MNILIVKNTEVFVDKEDLEYLSQFNWRIINGNYIARERSRTLGKITILLHREIINCPKNREVDHINGNPLDNRKENLRIVTRSKNMMNKRKLKDTFSSKYKGVHWHKHNKKWIAKLRYNKKDIYLGSFMLEKEAALAYNKKAKELFNEFANLNEV